MTDLRLQAIRKSFGAIETIKGIDLHVGTGKFVVFVGPSGCGKSTLLRLISGLESVSAGRILIGGRDVTQVAPAQRGVAMVFQSYALFPHMTVAENMSFGLRMSGSPRAEVERRVAAATDILQLGDLLQRRPSQLSGGQRQRVAIGRAIVRNPKIFLFDEPLSNLDAELRVQMRVEIAKLHHQLGNTMIYVTHDQIEAMTLADEIVVLRAGNVEQMGSPLELYRDPANAFVAGFIGSPKMNFIEAIAAGDGDGRRLRINAVTSIDMPLKRDRVAAGQKVMLGIRPEHCEVEGAEGVRLPVRADVIENLGATSFVYGRLEDDQPIVVERRQLGDVRFGQDLKVAFQLTDALFFAADGARLR